MDIRELIETRRNIKVFKEDPVDMEQILEWLQIARLAPNHRMTQPWEVWVVGPETRAKLNHKNNFGGAPVVLAVLSAPGPTPLHRDENLITVACFIDNFLLCAHEAGIGVGWSSFGASPVNREILGVPDEYDILGLLSVGYPEVVPDPKPRVDIREKVRYLP